ncbi:MAG: hypothetical protein WDO73_18630 [Ignavibacteriota bacterium]
MTTLYSAIGKGIADPNVVADSSAKRLRGALARAYGRQDLEGPDAHRELLRAGI